MAQLSIPAFDFLSYEYLCCIERSYAALIAHAAPTPQGEPDLGGKLLYVPNLNPGSCILIVAANIAGAATIVVSDDPERQRQAVREGVVDFLVTSLDEALRILKNEVRKRQPVAVCVGAAREAVEAEMRERGVEADLAGAFLAGPGPAPAPYPEGLLCEILFCWRVASAPARWLPRLDVLAADCLAPNELAARRWLRLSPRYLGRSSQNIRLLRCNELVAAQFIEAVRQRTESGELDVAIEIRLEGQYGPQVLVFQPPARSS